MDCFHAGYEGEIVFSGTFQVTQIRSKNKSHQPALDVEEVVEDRYESAMGN
jgi:hypothetical protein